MTGSWTRSFSPSRSRALIVATLASATFGAAWLPTASAAPSASPGSADGGESLFPGLGNGGYDVQDYNLKLTYSADTTDPVKGSVRIRAKATQNLSRFNLDFAGQDVGAVKVNGKPAKSTWSDGDLVITPSATLPKGKSFRVQISSFTSAAPSTDHVLFESNAVWSYPEGYFLMGQPNAMHTLFPCNDSPSDKATYSAKITAPKKWSAFAQGEQRSTKTAGSNKITKFRNRTPVAPQLMQILVGDFSEIDRGVKDGVHYRDVVPATRVEELDADLSHAPANNAWLEGFLGDYPFDTYGVAAVDTWLNFALETQTLSLFSADYSGFGSEPLDYVEVHEAAHHWWGDHVAIAHWNDLWISEGHATWFHTLTYAVKDNGEIDEDKLAEIFKRDYTYSNYRADEAGPVADPKSADTLFSPQVYEGGALALYALRQKMGAKDFEAFQVHLLGKYGGKSLSTRQYLKELGAFSGDEKLAAFMKKWLYSAELPPMPGHSDWEVAEVLRNRTTTPDYSRPRPLEDLARD